MTYRKRLLHCDFKWNIADIFMIKVLNYNSSKKKPLCHEKCWLKLKDLQLSVAKIQSNQ